MRQPGLPSGIRKGGNRTRDRRQPLVLLVIAVFGWPLPVQAQATTAQGAIASARMTDNACVADDFAAVSALIKDQGGRRNITAVDAEKQAGLLATLDEWQAEADDRSYLRETAWSSATLTRQGPEIAIARLNPWFAARLASAIREARDSGLPTAGIFSAYRPPAFGVGRFLDRFASLHAYGLAVDMRGIGDPHSQEAKLWYDIAGRHGIVCPYGVDNRREWNHCQATSARAVCRENPLRDTITAEGPIDLKAMFRVGNWFVDNPPAACVVVAADPAANAKAIKPHGTLAAAARSDRKLLHQTRKAAGHGVIRTASLRDKELAHLVAHDMGLAPSHPKTRSRR